jgi:RsmE family RNA methyltransferase
LNLILLESHEVAADGHVTLSGARARHLLTVLGVTPDRSVRLGLIEGPLGIGTVTSATGSTVTLRCAFEPAAPPRPRVDLLLALPRPKVMNRLWAQLAAIGVGQIILTNAERVERPYFDTHVITPEHYRPLLIEGLQQARDTRLPRVSVHRQFRVLIEDQMDALFPGADRIVADASPAQPMQSVVRAHDARVLLAIGPEGGWNGFELDLLRAHGFQPVSMGPRTLRSDTACIALLTLAHHTIGDASPSA